MNAGRPLEMAAALEDEVLAEVSLSAGEEGGG
jgi:hypothetical protein